MKRGVFVGAAAGAAAATTVTLERNHSYTGVAVDTVWIHGAPVYCTGWMLVPHSLMFVRRWYVFDADARHDAQKPHLTTAAVVSARVFHDETFTRIAADYEERALRDLRRVIERQPPACENTVFFADGDVLPAVWRPT